jgi:threonine/homoserine/homoserine lactone efflux protein
MLEAVLSGISLGLVLAMLVGPVFFMILDISIRRGLRSAVFFAAGVALNDVFYVFITYFSSAALHVFNRFQVEIGVAGGVLLMIFGVFNFLKKPHIQAADLDLGEAGPGWMYAGKGFMMNLLNPFVLLFWLGVSGAAGARLGTSYVHIVTFFSVAIVTVFLTDLLKAWAATRLRSLLRPSVLHILNRISGIALLLFGLRLCLKSLGATLFSV